ncbi:hypothetical protein HYS94_03115 [Candidatus Daviesbacteria bacterium]|nr:hypothetical protein [Candidatus Daviesbacteria bacterium]
MIEKPNWYGLRLAREASGVTAFNVIYEDTKREDDLVARPFAVIWGLGELIFPATMRFMREHTEYNPDKSLRDILFFMSSIATDVATNALIAVPGLDGPLEVVARRTTLNYATHMGIDFMQHISHIRAASQKPLQSSTTDISQTPVRRRTPENRTRPVQSARSPQRLSTKKPIEVQPLPINAGNIINMNTEEKGWLLRDETGQLIRDPEGLLTIEFPGPPKYTARIPESLIGTKYQTIDEDQTHSE